MTFIVAALFHLRIKHDPDEPQDCRDEPPDDQVEEPLLVVLPAYYFLGQSIDEGGQTRFVRLRLRTRPRPD